MNITAKMLRVLKDEKGFTQSDYQKTGFHPNTISNWRTGKSEPSLTYFKFFLECMECDFCDVYKKALEYEN